MPAGWRSCCLLMLIVTCGCSGSAPQPPLDEWFRDTHQHTNTPYGRPDLDSVRVDGDTVVFETADGTTVRQAYAPGSDGGYRRVGEPEVESPVATE